MPKFPLNNQRLHIWEGSGDTTRRSGAQWIPGPDRRKGLGTGYEAMLYNPLNSCSDSDILSHGMVVEAAYKQKLSSR